MPVIPSVASPRYDPCTAITAEEIVQAGLDPAEKVPYTASSDTVTEVGCRWYAPGGTSSAYTATIGQSTSTVEQYLANPKLTAEPTAVGDRPAVRFQTGTSRSECNLAVALNSSSVIIAITPNGTTYTRDQSCQDADVVAKAILPSLS